VRASLARRDPVARWALLGLLLLGLLAVFAAEAWSAPGPAAPRRPVSVKDSPGYQPLADPDSAAERIGRRTDAPLVRKRFAGGARSLAAFATAVLGAFHASSVDSMLALCVTDDEFRDILWREFPQSRPATGLRWDDAWPALHGRLNGGSIAAVREYGDHVYTLVRVETGAVVPYRNFKLHNGITIVARDDEGREHRITAIRSVAERGGRFKLYSMQD
jgi:hypothetical protein